MGTRGRVLALMKTFVHRAALRVTLRLHLPLRSEGVYWLTSKPVPSASFATGELKQEDKAP